MYIWVEIKIERKGEREKERGEVERERDNKRLKKIKTLMGKLENKVCKSQRVEYDLL